MVVTRVHQREIVEVQFRFLTGRVLVHPALVVSKDELQDEEEGMFYAMLISSKNIHPGYTIEIKPEDIDGEPMEKDSYFVTHFIGYFTLHDVISRRGQYVKLKKFNDVINDAIFNIFGDEQ